ncbi:MAG: HAMP domain-containing protein [Planctomycetes bacterium]|nr:HAMP domain-containing protein [Planctomycetota bacterium]
MPYTQIPKPRVGLRAKLVLATAVVALVMGTFLFGFLGPSTRQDYLERSEALIASGARAMRELAESDNTASLGVLTDVIEHSAEARRRALLDLPLELYDGKPERVRAAIEAHDASQAKRLVDNVRVLGRELSRRSEQRIGAHVAELTDHQATDSHAFASEVRTSYLLLSGGTLVALIVLLGFGLDRLIVRPVHRLRQASRRVAAGELTVEIDRDVRDEVGDLARDFAMMLDRLRASEQEIRDKNAQLEDWNQRLQHEVEAKTSHLEHALADLRSTQRELAHADKMAAIGTLAGGIAHEFNNLIGGIRGCVEDALEGESSADKREPLEVARRATDRAAAITQKLLRFARPRIEGRETIGLRDLVTEVLELVEPQARRQSVETEWHVDPDLRVVVNSGEMHQVLLNLLTNALESMPAGGRLTVEALRSGDRAEIRVIDTGTGIPTDQLPHVFDPFFTSKDGEAAGSRVGAGLGLSVSFGIVEAHGGTLRAESRPGEGSTFRITLPALARGSEND